MRFHPLHAVLAGALLCSQVAIGQQHPNLDAKAILRQQQDIRAEASAGKGRYKGMKPETRQELFSKQDQVVRLIGEVTRTMANNGVLPAVLSRNNGRGAPAVALLVTGLLGSGMVLMSYSRSLVDGFTFMSKVVTAANLPLYLFCAVALAVLWKRGDRSLMRDVLLIAVVGAAYVLFAFIGLGHEPFVLGLALIAVGLPLYAVMRWRREKLSAQSSP